MSKNAVPAHEYSTIIRQIADADGLLTVAEYMAERLTIEFADPMVAQLDAIRGKVQDAHDRLEALHKAA
jgi:hypothetical protein